MRRVHRGAFSAPSLASALAESKLSDQDKGFVTALVYGALRLELALDAHLKPLLKRPDKLPAEVLDALRLSTFEILYRGTPRHAAANAWVDAVKAQQPRLTGLTNAVLRRVARLELPPATAAGLPEWLYNEWSARFGAERAGDIAAGLNDADPLWLTAYHPEATHALLEDGCEVQFGPVESTLRVRLGRPLTELKAYKNGWVQPQNPASTLPVRVLGPTPDERVYDLASGSGIKAAQLAAAGAEVTSLELHPSKLERAEINLKRLGLHTKSIAHDLRTVPNLPPAPKVLLDAPCSGTGTLRGNPELRGRVTQEEVASLAALQRDLLNTAAALTAPGGVLVYAVCALTEAEGPEQTRWFLDTFSDFEAEPFLFDLPADNGPEGSTIFPLDGLDGFYLVGFRRN